MSKVLVTTVPFGRVNSTPIDLLDKAGIDYLINPIGRKLKEDELAKLIQDVDVLIAGTEPITDKVMSAAPNLKLISRVGVGLDGVDLLAAKNRNIIVSYTPDAPAPAVAELTIGLMFSLLRSIHVVNAEMHQGQWHRHFGRRISDVNIGVIGAGRIGMRVIQHLTNLGCRNILVNDTSENLTFPSGLKYKLVGLEDIYRESDIITLHVPLSPKTKDMIKIEQLLSMKSGAMVINTSRGGIINEIDLAIALSTGRLSGAAIDVFEQEPYSGPLNTIDHCLLTSHMGSMSIDCRSSMEIEATEEAIRFLTGKPLQGLVPSEEYELQRAYLG